MRVHRRGLARLQRQAISAHAFVFENRLAIGLSRLRGKALRTRRRPEKFNREVMKWRRPHIHRAMHISRFAKLDVAEIPLDLSGCSADRLDPEAGAAQRDDDVIVAMCMPEGRVSGRHRHIPDTHEFIFKFGVMARLAADFNR